MDEKTTQTAPEGESFWTARQPGDDRRDWRNGGTDWIDEYVRSQDHPHRQLIVDALAGMESVLELGCNTGPNLARLRGSVPKLAGIDANLHAIVRARQMFPEIDWRVGNIEDRLPFEDAIEPQFEKNAVVPGSKEFWIDSKKLD